MKIQFSKTLERITGCAQTEVIFSSSPVYPYELLRMLKTYYPELIKEVHLLIYDSNCCRLNEEQQILDEQMIFVDLVGNKESNL